MKVLTVFWYSLFLISCWLVRPVMAHHGKDFVATTSSELPERGTFWFIAAGDFRAAELLNNADSAVEFSPGMLYGFTPWLAGEVHPHIVKERGHGWSYEATGFELRLNPLNRSSLPIEIGLAVEFEIAGRAELNNEIDARLILSHENGLLNFTGNLVWRKELNGGEETFATLVGLRYSVNSAHSFALELLAFSGDENAVDVVPSWTVQLGHNQTLRVGAGMSLNGERPLLSLRTVYVFGL